MKEGYSAQNGLELKIPSRSSPPFYAKQRTLSPEGKKWTLTVDYAQLTASGQSPEFLAPAIQEITPNNLREEQAPLRQ